MSATIDNRSSLLIVEGFGELPSQELKVCDDGTIKFRYIVEGSKHPGFDGEWRLVSEREQREHLYLGGKIAQWLRTINRDQIGRDGK